MLPAKWPMYMHHVLILLRNIFAIHMSSVCIYSWLARNMHDVRSDRPFHLVSHMVFMELLLLFTHSHTLYILIMENFNSDNK